MDTLFQLLDFNESIASRRRAKEEEKKIEYEELISLDSSESLSDEVPEELIIIEAVPKISHSQLVAKTAITKVIETLANYLTILVQPNLTCKPLVYESLAERYEGKKKYEIDSSSEEKKIQKDIGQVLVFLDEMIKQRDVRYMTFELDDFLETYTKMKMEADECLKHLDELKSTQNYLKLQIVNERNTLEAQIAEAETRVQEKFAEYREIGAYCNESLEYCKKWERSRSEQNSLTLLKKENIYNYMIDGTMDKIVVENMIHNNVADFCNESREEYVNDIETWMKKYDKEMDQRDLDNITMMARTEKLVNEKEDLKVIYEKRAEEILDYLEGKRQKKIRKMILAVENRAARKIQVWWREVMIRKKLGPYRKKDKGGKAKKKKRRDSS